jgi:eukaryotic-like serine/threonine-protein kinase
MSAHSEPATASALTEPRTAATRTRHDPPLVLGRYRLHRRLGSGGFGTVWMAHDERLERDVAVKILPRERVVGGRFEREARAAARLAHPAIVTLYEAAIDDDGAYLVSELVRGPTLADLLEAGRLSDRDIVRIAIALCDALAHAHAEGIVHRDVKPSNVLVPARPVTRAQVAKLTDFGVARVIGGDSLTRTGDVVGTAAYMAPEQAEGLEAGAPADLYALALVTYEALTGVNPVRTGTAGQRARRLGAYLPPLRRQRRELPRELGLGIDRALRPRLRERGTLVELRTSLFESLPLLEDKPGIVTSPWPLRRRAEQRAVPEEGIDEARWSEGPRDAVPDGEAETPESSSEEALPWPARGLAAIATAALTVWLCAHALSSLPVSPAVVGLLAALAVVALPRIGWLAVTGALTVAAVAQGRPGVALLILVAAVIPVALLPRGGAAWAVAAGAPALGLIGLAGAWPALAGRARGPWRRLALGAVGWVWVVLAGAIGGTGLYVHAIPGVARPSAWSGSLPETMTLVIRPVISSGVLAGAVVWAVAALVLPWVRRGRSLGVDIVVVTVWAATLVSATDVALAMARPGEALMASRAAVIGGLAAAVVALSPSVLEAMRTGRAGARLA